MLYQDDHDGILPSNVAGNPDPLYGYSLNWVESTTHGPTSGFIDSGALNDPKRAAFAPYLGVADVYSCPADRSSYPVGDRRIKKLRSYSMNKYLGGGFENGLASLPPPDLVFKRNTEFTKPADVFVFIDVEALSICYSLFEIPGDSFFNGPGAFHDGRKGVLSYVDGHAETHKWKKPVILPITLERVSEPHTTLAVKWDPQDVLYVRSRAHD